MSMTFKQFLAEETTSGSEGAKLFNPERFRSAIEKVLEQMIKRAGDSKDERHFNELALIEAISVVKEVLIDRLSPYLDPKYKERRGKGNADLEQTVEAIAEQIKDTLHVHFSNLKPAMNQFVNTVVAPILDEVSRVGLGNAVKHIDASRLDSTSRDAFGHLMRFVMSSDVISNKEDAAVAKNLLNRWSKEARVKRKATKKVTRRQRLNTIRAAVEAIQGNE